ncbi:VCBS repeat-containing protein [Tunicatimonas pelagia]|uniref:VCBS repeat-containing protein n=1 Tax=Tunicatimonas pelagia TaxID=931531 RepID=UPI00266623E3|nr:VCBS repeat-containing protein [Tunicatimonas pelagia]WKN42414.1 VCBS repeat-containing protein [Tunicatimonas pelagia]
MRTLLLACLGTMIYQVNLAQLVPTTMFTLLPPDETGIEFRNDIEDTRERSILIYSNYYGGGGVGIGDINSDGLPDIFLAGNLVGDRLYLNQGNLKFEDITQQAGIQNNGGWSSGVVLGDVNQDGYLDIYVTRELYDHQPELRKNKLYINTLGKTGKVGFEEASAEYGVDNSERTRHATFLDYDQDGDFDLFLLNQPPNPGDYSSFYGTELLQDKYSPRLLQNQGGQFADVTEAAGLLRPGFANSVSASDLNGDGWTDLYVSNDFEAPDFIYFNNGDGTFSEGAQDVTRHTSFYSMGVDAGDINNDGLLDVVVADMVAEDNYRLKANMSGMNPAAFWQVVEDGGHYQYMFNTLQLNTALPGNTELEGQSTTTNGGYLRDIAQLAGVASTDWSWSTLFADLDNDGWKDLHITNGLLRDIRNSDASKKFAKYIESAISAYLAKNPNPEGISIWDIADINEALALTPSVPLMNYAYHNKGNQEDALPTFEKVSEAWGLDQETFSSGSAYADLDNDGDLDLVINNVNAVAMVYRNNAQEVLDNHYLRVNLVADDPAVTNLGVKIWAETGGDTQFFETTSVRGMYSTSESIVHIGLGRQASVDKLRIRWPNGREQLLEEVLADQTIQVRYANARAVDQPLSYNQGVSQPLFTNVTSEQSPAIQHEENNFDDFEKQVLLPHRMSDLGPALATGDVNGDGQDDFYLGGAAGQPGQLFLQQEDGTFIAASQEAWQINTASEDMGSVFFDADGDGDEDLYVVSGGNEFAPQSAKYQDRLYLNDGNGAFALAADALPTLRNSGSKVYPEDIDQDGDLDLFVAGRHIPWSYPEPASSTLLLNEGGKFTDVSDQLCPDLKNIGMVNDAVWVDFSGDGRQDLVLAGEWMPITLLQNDGNTFTNVTANYELEGSTGWWFSVAAADMDGDGDQDVIAGNLGMNYKYQASDEEPFEVFYYDFDENGSKDVVLAYYNFGIQYPLRGRSCSSQQVPMIKDKFKSYDLFASADLVDVYEENALEESLNYRANTFASVYLENTGNGTFKQHVLPAEAQFSSVNDILIADYNQDQNLDILLAGNLYGSEIETTRNDAGVGLVLLGDGQGKFQTLTPAASGFFVPSDVKDMAVVQSTRGKQVLVGSNNSQVQIFRLDAQKVP